MASYRKCAQDLGIEKELDEYLAGVRDVDDPVFRQKFDEAKREAMHKKYQAELDAIVVDDIYNFLDNYKTAWGKKHNKAHAVRAFLTMDNAKTGRVSVEQQAIASSEYYMHKMHVVLDQMDNRGFFKKLFATGDINTNGRADDLVRELFKPGAIADPEIKKLAKVVRDTLEEIRTDFNQQGGFIRRLDGYGLPQRHQPSRMLQGFKNADEARDNWVEFTAPKLDLQRMQIATLEDAKVMLKDVFDTIVTDGASKADPKQFRPGSKMANRHRDHRSLHFRDGDEWLAYQKKFGDRDIIGAVMQHVIGMGREIGILRTMGTNPEARMKDMMRVVEIAQKNSAVTGKDKTFYGPNHLNAIWRNVAGMPADGSRVLKHTGAVVRGIATAAKLGGALVSSLPDVASALTTAAYNGSGAGRYLGQFFKQITPVMAKGGRKLAQEYGQLYAPVIDDFIGAARFSDPEATKIARALSTSVYKMGLLTAWDRANRTAVKMSMLGAFSKAPAKLSDFKTTGSQGQLLRTLERYGIDEQAWAAAQAAKQNGIINPLRMSPDMHARFQGMIETEQSRAIVKPGARTQAIINQGNAPGTFAGEATRSMFQWKSYPIAVFQNKMLMQATAIAGKYDDPASVKLALFANMFGTAIAMGMVSVQMKELSKGRTMITPDSGGDWLRLIGQGAVQAGLGGLVYEAFWGALGNGRSPGAVLAPPALQMFDDLLTMGIMADVDKQGMEVIDKNITDHLGTAAVNILGWIPGQSLWYTRAMYEQILIPAVAAQVSPQEMQRLLRRQQRIEARAGQEHWNLLDLAQ